MPGRARRPCFCRRYASRRSAALQRIERRVRQSRFQATAGLFECKSEPEMSSLFSKDHLGAINEKCLF